MPAVADVYTAIADPTRRQILDLLAEDGLSAGELAAPFQMSRPAVSQHLRVLREAGLVTDHKEGRQRIYRLEPGALRDVDLWLASYRRFWQAKHAALGDYLDKSEEPLAGSSISTEEPRAGSSIESEPRAGLNIRSEPLAGSSSEEAAGGQD